MEKVILLRIGEIHLKGKNRNFFEKVLKNNLVDALKEYNCKVYTTSSRYYISNYQDNDEPNIIDIAKKIFGFVSLSVATKINTSRFDIETFVSQINLVNKSFRVSVIRADKTFPINSNEYEKILGGLVLTNNPNSKVKLKNFDSEILVDIREDKNTYICYEKIPCAGGMPVGSGSNSLLLLSGGIDSPVAGYMMAKRGVRISALHFHSYPYTSELAKQKVIDLAKIMSSYTGSFRLSIINFKEIQEEIHKKCKAEYMITIMRRMMMRIAEQICKNERIKSITTGENLGQVASQTMEGMISTSEVVTQAIPIFRPLLCFDKVEIMSLAEKIGTYETSILPYEDCCTVFLPKNPLIKPKIDLVKIEEEKIDIESLIKNAINNLEIIDC